MQASPINMHVYWLENMCVLIDRLCSIYVIYNKASCLCLNTFSPRPRKQFQRQQNHKNSNSSSTSSSQQNSTQQFKKIYLNS
jgi:hypothetical protein